MELPGPKIKNFVVFSQKKVFLIFQETELSSPNIKKFQERTFQTQQIIKKNILKKFLVFLEMKLTSPKIKKVFLIFQEGTCKA